MWKRACTFACEWKIRSLKKLQTCPQQLWISYCRIYYAIVSVWKRVGVYIPPATAPECLCLLICFRFSCICSRAYRSDRRRSPLWTTADLPRDESLRDRSEVDLHDVKWAQTILRKKKTKITKHPGIGAHSVTISLVTKCQRLLKWWFAYLLQRPRRWYAQDIYADTRSATWLLRCLWVSKNAIPYLVSETKLMTGCTRTKKQQKTLKKKQTN